MFRLGALRPPVPFGSMLLFPLPACQTPSKSLQSTGELRSLLAASVCAFSLFGMLERYGGDFLKVMPPAKLGSTGNKTISTFSEELSVGASDEH